MYKRATNWSCNQGADVVNRRAGGRRRYNAERKAKAWERRFAIMDELGGYSLLPPRGAQIRLAARFGVNRSTICRDIEAIREEWRKPRRCPLCWTVEYFTLKHAARLAKMGFWDGCTSKRCAKV